MTPEALCLVRQDASSIDPEPFAEAFYDTLFALAPAARDLFPDDLSEQRRKLMAELTTMITMATSMVEGELDHFVDRAHALGRRHVRYGATAEHYRVVGTALLATLASSIETWDDAHQAAWSRLYTLVASTMQETHATT